jgi:hypothetical protein
MQCKARKKTDGTRCPNTARPGEELCWVHTPKLAEQREEGRKQGGRVRLTKPATLAPDTPDVPLGSVRDVVIALGSTFNMVRTGRLGVSVGNCLAVLSQVLLKALCEGDLEQRIQALEARAASSNGMAGRVIR